ncbi:MAG: hypothetical protein H6830_04455 [Planctomycetes bacterium]|nr:hypothetical protein [Planctomycetota bacterium]MCB9910487.1 hypothetical protein [Planctomycetota bacterium]MCB9912613.1 hypothetical protein [Planctomycetota bacterium]
MTVKKRERRKPGPKPKGKLRPGESWARLTFRCGSLLVQELDEESEPGETRNDTLMRMVRIGLRSAKRRRAYLAAKEAEE